MSGRGAHSGRLFAAASLAWGVPPAAGLAAHRRTVGGYLAFYALSARIGSGRAAVITYVAQALRAPQAGAPARVHLGSGLSSSH